MKWKVECCGGRYDGTFYQFDELPFFIKVSRKHETDLGSGKLVIGDKEVAHVTSAKATGESGVEYYQQYKIVAHNHYKYKMISEKDYIKKVSKRGK